MPFARLLNFRAAACVLALLLCGGWLWWKCLHDDNIAFLPKQSPAQWIVYPKPPDTNPRHAAAIPATFERSFVLASKPSTARLAVRAFKAGAVRINGREVEQLRLPGQNWKTASTADVAEFLQIGTNHVSVNVTNSFGPPALWLTVSAGGSSLWSDRQWDVSLAGATWLRAACASDGPAIRPGNPLFGRERVSDSLRRAWPELLVILALSAAIVAGFRWLASKGRAPSPEVVLILVVTAWLALFCNNLPKLAPLLGFDRDGHTEYINYILQKGVLPLADAGWQMYQPPLYYLLSAGLLGALDLSASSDAGLMVLRVESVLTGLMHIGLLFLCLRLVFPRLPSCQIAGLLLGAFLPANLYLSHHPTNEGLAALFVTASIYFTLRLLKPGPAFRRLYAGAGVCLGLALLTKFSAVLAVPFVFGSMVWREIQDRSDSGVKHPHLFASLGSKIGLAVLSTLVVCGWHYLRVWQHFGNPLIGNWDPKLPFAWWQDPGYRIAGWYWHFGASLVAPLYSSISGFADGLYSSLWGDGLASGSARIGFRPPWDYDLMNVGYLIALPITLLLLFGAALVLIRLIRKPSPDWFLIWGLGGAFAFGLLFMTLKVPSYAQVKAFYALPALLPLSALAAAGWKFLNERTPGLRPVLWTGTLAWALTSYGTLWVHSDNPFTWTAFGISLADDGRYEEAVRYFSRAVQLDPRAVNARVHLANALEHLKRHAEAGQQVALALRQAPDDPGAMLGLAVHLSEERRNEEAAGRLRETVSRAPDFASALYRLATVLSWVGQPPETLTACQEALRLDPFDQALHQMSATAAAATGEITNAVFHWRCLLALDSDKVEALNNLAWILAANADPALRSGVEAVHLAERACKLTENREPLLLGTLAAAYAEAGRFGAAVTAAERAKTLAVGLGQKEVADRNGQLLQLYRAGKPYHEP